MKNENVSITNLMNAPNNVLNNIPNNQNKSHNKINHSLKNLSTNNKINKSKINKSNKKIMIEKKYTLVDFPEEGKLYGDFKGKTPLQAAKKAFTQLARLSKLNNSNGKFIVFVIREKKNMKKNGSYRDFKYIGQRIKLPNPIVIKMGNKNITYHYQNVVNRYKSDS